MKKKKVGLALSGGAALGFAHIGIIKVLIENNIPIDVISGTSMGSLIGGVFAAGVPIDEMEKILETFSRKNFIDINPFVLSDGLLHGKKVTDLLKKLVADKKIEDCKIKYCAVASDLNSGNKYVFKKGDLVTAIRASISIPGVFRPVKIDKMCLVDGGTHDNLPVGEARNLGADIVIGVDVCSSYKRPTAIKNTIDILLAAVNTLISSFVQSQSDKGDIYIQIEQPGVTVSNFSAEEAIKSVKYGEKYAKKFLPTIKQKLEEAGIKIKEPKKVKVNALKKEDKNKKLETENNKKIDNNKN